MGWVAGSDVSTGDLISAAQWNNYLGATGSLEYLKTEADKIDDVSHDEPARALDTIYQNSTKIRLIVVTVDCAGTASHESAQIKIGSGTPPTTIVAITGFMSGTAALVGRFVMSAIVPPNWYYEVDSLFNTPDLIEWHEWDLH